jgi:1-aminocyclopropane-1-carboxylate deaminase
MFKMNFLKNDFPPSPLQEMDDALLKSYNIRLFLKRDDLLHISFPKILFGKENLTPSVISNLSTISGNKFRKMKHNLLEMEQQGLKKVVTFGGAFSNHIHATAAAGQLLGFETVGLIRGERSPNLSPTLRFAEECGMILHFINRNDYRDKNLIINELKTKFGDFYYLPEGGTNHLAVRGTAEIVSEIEAQLDNLKLYNLQGTNAASRYICVPCGTGGTIAGIIAAANTATTVLGFSALKGDFLQDDVTALLQDAQNAADTEGASFFSNPLKTPQNWSINTEFHCGGYARFTPELIGFINNFKEKHGVPLDPIYTGKMLLGIYKLAEMGFFPQNSTIIAVHTGGLQGIEGFNQRFGNLLSV